MDLVGWPWLGLALGGLGSHGLVWGWGGLAGLPGVAGLTGLAGPGTWVGLGLDWAGWADWAAWAGLPGLAGVGLTGLGRRPWPKAMAEGHS